MLLDPPEVLMPELNRRFLALGQAQTNYDNNPSSLNLLVLNTAKTALNKTLDKCSVELGVPITPRPAIVPQEDGTLKLEYEA